MFNLYERIVPYGDHYDFLADKQAEDSLAMAVELNQQLEQPHDKKRIRTRLAETLSSVVGFRKAEVLAKQSPKDVTEALAEEAQRRGKARKNLVEIVEIAARKATRKNTAEFAQTEIRRDSYYYFGMRSGIIAIYNLLHGTNLTPEGFSQALLDGRRLNDVVADTRVLNVAKVLPSAVIYNQERKWFEETLVQSGVGRDEVSRIMKSVPYAPAIGDAVEVLSGILGKRNDDVQEALVKCFAAKGVFDAQFEEFAGNIGISDAQLDEAKRVLMQAVKGVGSELRIVQAFSDIQKGLLIEYVLVGQYKREWVYPLARNVIDNVKLRRYKIQPGVHTTIADQVHEISSYYKKGIKGISRPLLVYLFQESNDFRSLVTAWSIRGGRKLFYPKHEISYGDLGTVFGTLFLGHQSRMPQATSIQYTLGNRTINEVFDIMELIGFLEVKPAERTDSRGSKELERITGKSYKETTYISNSIGIPSHFGRIVDMVVDNLEELSQNKYFCRAALKAWLDERGRTEGGHAIAHFSIEPRSRYTLGQEDVVRKLAQPVGLSVSRGGLYEGNSGWASVKNPEVVGYIPRH